MKFHAYFIPRFMVKGRCHTNCTRHFTPTTLAVMPRLSLFKISRKSHDQPFSRQRRSSGELRYRPPGGPAIAGIRFGSPDALLTGLRDALKGNAPAVPLDVIHLALRTVHEHADAVRQEHQPHLVVEGDTFLADNARQGRGNLTESALQFKC